MALHIVIDGYNFIRRSRRLSTVEQFDMQAAREMLVTDLAAYKKIRPHAITIVFDGTDAPPDLPRRSRLKGIELRFSRSGESADSVIKRMAVRERERVLIVSSDRDIAESVEKQGAAVIDTEAFENRLAQLRNMDIKDVEEDGPNDGWRPSTRKKGPARRLPKNRRKMRRRINKL
jgi:predicted RNA-binding protein with PIN domain